MSFASVNAAASAALEPWFELLSPLPVAGQVAVTALPVTLFALAVFRVASDQAGIRAAKERIKAHLLELWLYKDDPLVLLKAQGRVFWHSLAYLGHSLLPLAVMIGPVALVLVQLEARFAYRALAPGEAAILTVSLADGARTADAALAVGTGLVAETPALRIPDRAQVLWRLRGAAPGEHAAGVSIGGARIARRIVVGEGARALAPVAYRADDWRILGFPAEPPLPDGAGVVAVEVEYPRARGQLLGLSSASWLLFGATLLFGFALRRSLGVTF